MSFWFRYPKSVFKVNCDISLRNKRYTFGGLVQDRIQNNIRREGMIESIVWEKDQSIGRLLVENK